MRRHGLLRPRPVCPGCVWIFHVVWSTHFVADIETLSSRTEAERWVRIPLSRICVRLSYTRSCPQELFGSTLYLVSLIVTCLGFASAYTAIPDTGERLSRKENDLRGMLWWKAGCENLTDSAVAGRSHLATFQSAEAVVQQQYKKQS
jgi:hypothetical protein